MLALSSTIGFIEFKGQPRLLINIKQEGELQPESQAGLDNHPHGSIYSKMLLYFKNSSQSSVAQLKRTKSLVDILMALFKSVLCKLSLAVHAKSD